MIYVIVGLIALIVIIRLTAPKRYRVHASAVKPLPPGVEPEERWVPGFIVNAEGHVLDVGGKFIGHTMGDSMVHFGIAPNSTFLGDRMAVDECFALVKDEVVVVSENGAPASSTGLALRIVDRVDSAGLVYFQADAHGAVHPPVAMEAIHARVTHVLHDGYQPGFLMGTLRNVFGRSRKSA